MRGFCTAKSAGVLLFRLVGANLQTLAHLLVPAAVLLLCFVMHLQKASITKISSAEIRTKPLRV